MNASSLQTIKTDAWDVIVIGAGVAGAGFAIQSARLGWSTLLVEAKAFPRDKVCGGCLNQRAQTILKQLGVWKDDFASSGQSIRQLELQIGKTRSLWKIPELFSVSRRTLDGHLVQTAIEAGTVFLSETRASLLPEASVESPVNSIAVELHSKDERRRIVGRVAIIADGLTRSSLRYNASLVDEVAADSHIGIQTMIPAESCVFRPRRDTLEMLVGNDGYVGIAHCENEMLDVAAAVDPQAVRRFGGPARAVAAVLEEVLQRKIDFPPELPWLATPLMTRKSSIVAGNRWLSIGDSTGYVEPFTGEGMSWALADATTALPLVDNALDRGWTEATVTEWHRTVHRSHIRNQRRCRMLASQLRHPVRAEWMLKLFNLVPTLRNYLVRKIVS